MNPPSSDTLRASIGTGKAVISATGFTMSETYPTTESGIGTTPKRAVFG